jgi:hypothetical protein
MRTSIKNSLIGRIEMRTTPRTLELAVMMTLLLPLWGCVAHDADAIYRQRAEERKKQYAAEPHYFAKYDIALVDVDRPAQAKDRYGDVSTRKIETSNGSVNQAEDQSVKIVWSVPLKEFSFELLNKLEQSIKIPWDEAAYVDISGQSHRVVHSGVKFSDLNASQPPSVVPAKGRLTDIMIPTDNVRFMPGRYGGWGQSTIFHCVKGYVCDDSNQRLALAQKGLTYRILLPFQLGAELYNYTFIFRVNNVEIVSDKKEGYSEKAPDSGLPIR